MIASILLNARQAVNDHLGSDVEVFDNLGNALREQPIKAVVSKQPVQQDNFGNTLTPYLLKFPPSEFPEHAPGQLIKTWQGNFYLQHVIENTASRITYSLRPE